LAAEPAVRGSIARTCISRYPRYNKVWNVEALEWAKAHFFVGVCNFKAMQPVILSRIEEIAERVARSEGIEVVEVEVKGGGKNQFVRISIDKPEGVSHADCEFISHQVGAILDVEDVVPRKLIKPRDYERFQGKKAKVTLREPVESQRHWEGVLTGYADGVVSLDANGKQIRFPLDQVTKANLKFEW